MHPRAVVHLTATGGALLAITLWWCFGARLREGLGWWGPNPFEWLLVALLGYFAGGIAGMIGTELRNRRNQAPALRALCETMGLAFAADVPAEGPGSLAGSPLLKEYRAFSNRMSGELNGTPVEMLDATYMVRSRDQDGFSTEFVWCRTVVFFPQRTSLPDLALMPQSVGPRLRLALLGAPGVTFTSEDLELAAIARRFARAYHVHADDGMTSEKALQSMLRPEALDYLAGHPGWTVTVAGGRMALWREERVVPASRRRAMLEEALAIYQLLTRPPRPSEPALAVQFESPIDPSQVQARLMALFGWCAGGLFTGGLIGGIAALALSPAVGAGAWAGLLFGVFFAPALLGATVGAYIALRRGLPRKRGR